MDIGPALLGVRGNHGDSLLHLGSPDTGQPAILSLQGSQTCAVGVGGQPWAPARICWVPQPAGRLWERNLFLFGWTHWPLSVNKGTRVQPWPAHFVHLLLQPEAGKDLGSSWKEEPVTATRGEAEVAWPRGACSLASVSMVALWQGRRLAQPVKATASSPGPQGAPVPSLQVLRR